MSSCSGRWVCGRLFGVNPRRVGHPAAFPEELPRRLIKIYSYPGDLVLDPFAGPATRWWPPKLTIARSGSKSTRPSAI